MEKMSDTSYAKNYLYEESWLSNWWHGRTSFQWKEWWSFLVNSTQILQLGISREELHQGQAVDVLADM